MGSGNAGATNMARVFGWGAGILTLAGDAAKAVICMVLANLWIGDVGLALAGMGCILGHCYPVLHDFKGGKGVASAAGFVLGFHWTFLPVALIMFLVPFVLTSYVSLGSLLMYSGLLIQLIIEGQKGFFAPASQAVLVEMYIIQAVLTAMAFWQHRENIKRLIAGKENKTVLWHKSE